MSRKSVYRKYLAKDGRVLLGIMVNKKFPNKIAYGGQLYDIEVHCPAAWSDAKVKNWTEKELARHRPDNPNEYPESS